MAFAALSPSVWMMTPQLTEQYGQVLRVSLVWEILRVLACAWSGAMSNPNADSAPPAMVVWTNARREISTQPPTVRLKADTTYETYP
jgi:hypothetical protein